MGQRLLHQIPISEASRVGWRHCGLPPITPTLLYIPLPILTQGWAGTETARGSWCWLAGLRGIRLQGVRVGLR